ncbi:hypothetical protein BJ741DRAFT_613858 [Chytriomyces cf. hyalinus JEL632]|nr:hypothetical protein BJ741DRAFT_613858 [Chytriomyces cf. hyalinus JEL632]
MLQTLANSSTSSTSIHAACIDDDQEFVLRALLTDWQMDMDALDESGNTPLIYAACWGRSHIAALLVAGGADLEGCDQNGWTPLMWASANNHTHIADLLLKHGADSMHRNARGRSVSEIARSSSSCSVAAPIQDSSKGLPVDPLELDEYESGSDTTECNDAASVSWTAKEDEGISGYSKRFSRTSSTLFRQLSKVVTGVVAVGKSGSEQGAESSVHGSEGFLGSRDGIRRSASPPPRSLLKRAGTDQMDRRRARALSFADLGDDDEDEETHLDATAPFMWDTCKLDQILIFEEGSVSRILQVAISDLRPAKLALGKPIPANVIFLCARYAHYLGSLELLEGFMAGALDAICKEIRAHCHSIQLLAFWISNCAHLLYYFQKDPSLALATIRHHTTFAELIHELYDLMNAQVRFQLEQVVDAAILDYTDPESIVEEPSSAVATVSVDEPASVRYEPQPPVVVRVKPGPPARSNSWNPIAGLGSAVKTAAERVGRYSMASISLVTSSASSSTAVVSSSDSTSGKSSDSRYKRTLQPSVTYKITQSQNAHPSLVSRKTHVFKIIDATSTDSISNLPPPPSPTATKTLPKSTPAPNPRTITTLLSKISTTLHLSNMHPHISTRIMRQTMHTLNHVLISGILCKPRCSRKRAVSIRVNLNPIEQYIQRNAAFFTDEPAQHRHESYRSQDTVSNADSVDASTAEYTSPLLATVQLTQFLHVLTALDGLESYLDVSLNQLPLVTPGMACSAVLAYESSGPGDVPVAQVVDYVEKMGTAYRELRGGDAYEESEGLETVVLKVPFMDGVEEEQDRNGWRAGRPFVPEVVLRMLDSGDGSVCEEGEGSW